MTPSGIKVTSEKARTSFLVRDIEYLQIVFQYCSGATIYGKYHNTWYFQTCITLVLPRPARRAPESRRYALSPNEQKQALEETVRQRTFDLKQALAAVRASEQLLAKTQRLSAVGTMASGIAHDFNNALMLIMGSGEILLSDAERHRLTRDNAIPLLQDILTAARDASNLVGQLRRFSRSGDAGEVHQPINLSWLIEQAVSFTRPKWDTQAFGAGSQIRMVVDFQDVPVILGDGGRLRDAITNLIFNAVDAMPQGGTLTLRTRVEGEFVLLEISDTGIGMTEEVRRNCFEPFFTTKGQEGTGLGLAMVYGIVQHHSGSIEVASKPGKGTTFTLRLPTRPPAVSEHRE
jgi:signal transduction histidine kinase